MNQSEMAWLIVGASKMFYKYGTINYTTAKKLLKRNTTRKIFLKMLKNVLMKKSGDAGGLSYIS